MHHALSPNHSPPRVTTHCGIRPPGLRAPSRSMIPAPVFQIPSPSRPETALSNYRDHDRHGRESTPCRMRPSVPLHWAYKTPEATLRLRAQAVCPSMASSAPEAREGSRVNNSPASDDEIPCPARSSHPPASSPSLPSTPLAQRSPSCLSSRLNDFWWRSGLDVRSQASTKWESCMATKKLMVRFGGG